MVWSCQIMFFSARRRERLGRGTGGRWMTCVTAGTATAARAGFFGVNTHSSSSLSDSESVTSGRGDEDHSRRTAAISFYLFSRRQFSAHTKSSRSCIDKRTVRATGNTRYRNSKIAPLDHKMADNCVSQARTNTVSSTITKPIKTWKTSNKSYSYNLLNCINKMYTHDLFYLQQEWEAWLAPVYIQIRTTKSKLTQCTKYNCH